ncbi:hypothetical protein [Bowmanella dokdonensis]|uniref:Mu-like prophage FluMu N-terminal domain-containing protein n=1 Tax=Bowmanella dokdonensis TaxID=751969 RepID=A0A939IQ88_9ALTE|nr:hypothetical protein [Bowmanella dokdonensis]MBN7824774.1 hypothetical protein [Bowmanella dokdonensis]
MSNKQSYLCNWPVKHNGKRYVKGDAIPELTDEQVQALGAAVTPGEPDNGASDLSEEQQLAAVVEAISKLEPGNEAHWTKGGKPECAALTELVGFQVPAKLRDAAWDQVEASKGE